MSAESPFLNSDPADDATSAPAFSPADEDFSDDDGVLYDEEVTPEYGILGFTLRELIIVGAWLVLFVLSFFPLGWSPALWAQGISWILPIGVPTVAVFLLVLRRLSPDGIRRVGSLGIDQFASVAFSVAAVWWAQVLWDYVALVIRADVDAVVWVPWVQFIVALALVALTVFAPLIPGIKEDFRGRLVTLAHRNANPVRPVIARPRPERPEPPAAATSATGSDETATPAGYAPAPYLAPNTQVTVPASGLDTELTGQQATDEVARLDVAEQVPLSSHASGGGTGTEQATSDETYTPSYSRSSWEREPEVVSDTGSIEAMLGARAQDVDAAPQTHAFSAIDEADLDATNPRDPAPAAQPFWILAPTERDVHDELGEPIFRIGPSAWALVIEDRGGAYVVRHDDGRIGYLHDIADITKG
ncbi:hypothetical protein [Microbacterium hydrocarbonoxydans]|uniref:hypothetical protein n=1 Tax=Microbacterium hydrocarbonoxydans TaxID=273678 RepID=UPI00203B8040|nr:hypothetical protein [Microbacterium hydrocarbonoxydans]MCM3781029.1 hypothetical protein [Microbacterium hydrocarbonoxydans]